MSNMLKATVLIVIVAFLAKFFVLDQINVEEPQVGKESQPIDDTVKIFSHDELLQTKTTANLLYLAVLGRVYDVSSGAKHYQPGGSYDFFVGVDGSRAYVTGKFKDDLTDDVDGLSESQIADLFNWRDFYEKNYKYIGIVNGRFYDANGVATPYLHQCEELLANHKQEAHKQGLFNKRFPTCNSEWSQQRGGLVRVWCSTMSGGIERDWTGYPRLVYNPNTKTEQCSCVNIDDLQHAHVKPYENCDPTSIQCTFL